MATADELLKNLTMQPDPEGHIVVGADRFITVPATLKRLGVQHDHNIETVTFDCPRYWDNHDMSTMTVYINYMLSNGYSDRYIADNVTADEDIMHFEWTISRNVTQVPGKVSFLVCVMKTDADGTEERHWNSEVCQDCSISAGMECTEVPIETNPDIVTQLLLRMDSVEQKTGAQIDDTQIGADTWSSRNIVDKLCPSIVETGNSVTVSDNIEGYPLHVYSDTESDGILHIGKNLVGHSDFNNMQKTKRIISCENGVYTVEFTSDITTAIIFTNEGVSAADIPHAYWKNRILPPGRYTLSINQEGTDTYDDCYAIVMLIEQGEKHVVRTGTHLSQWSTIDGFYCTKKTFKKGTKITFTLQLEMGDKATDHEPCQKELLPYNEWSNENGEVVKWGVDTDVMPYEGVNTFFDIAEPDSYASITVTGKANPTKVIEKLTNAIVTLGGNV